MTEEVFEPTLRRGEEIETDELALLSADAPVDERPLRATVIGLAVLVLAAKIHGS